MKKRAGIALLVLAVMALVFVFLRPDPVDVESATLARGSLSIAVQEQGRTRARHRYSVAAPVTGQLLRADVVVGQRVEQGEVLVRIAPPPEDPRTEATARADLSAAQARQRETEALLEEARGTVERTRNELIRRHELYNKGLISVETRDQYAQTADAAKARLASSEASVAAARAQVESARSRLLGVDGDSAESSLIDVAAPVAGQVLRILEESARVVPAGTPLFELAAGDALELVIDVLTQDAVAINVGDAIQITGWGGNETLTGTVRSIEPRAFTKVSTLGVEEQRVNVIGDLIDPPASLGAEYRIDAAIIIWQDDDVLLVPTSAIFRRDGNWHLFVIDDGVARLKRLTIGKRGPLLAEVVDGAVAGDEVILYPSDQVSDGVRVVSR